MDKDNQNSFLEESNPIMDYINNNCPDIVSNYEELLSNKHANALLSRFGPEKTKQIIDKIEGWITEEATHKKSLYKTIVNWGIKNDNEKFNGKQK